MTTQTINALQRFISPLQLSIMKSLSYGEEGDFYNYKMLEFAERFEKMPKTYGQENAKDPIVYLHYFYGTVDWFITEKDMEDEQHQAFGLVKMFGEGSLGYISIEELKEAGVEIDLYFTPKPLSEVKKEYNC